MFYINIELQIKFIQYFELTTYNSFERRSCWRVIVCIKYRQLQGMYSSLNPDTLKRHYRKRGALRPIRNHKIVKKIIKNRKKIRSKPKTSCKTVNTGTFSHPSYYNPDRSDTVLTSGAYRVNYTNFITGFRNAMDLPFASSSICLD